MNTFTSFDGIRIAYHDEGEGLKGRRIGEDKPGTQPDSPARPCEAITSGIQPQMTLAEV